MTIIFLSFIALAFTTLSAHFFSKDKALLKPVLFACAVVAVALLIWFTSLDQSEKLDAALIQAAQEEESQPKTVNELIEQIENQLRADSNNSKLWYELGHGYLASSRFEEASVCFSYVLRLEEEPTASVFAAKATADYYANAQRINDNIQALLDQALTMDPFNYPALMLIGNDHYISFRYQEAIDTWQHILDSERQGLDRATVINSINRAKEML
jgi:formate-dependent nitrite reductase complex subunit NrfG